MVVHEELGRMIELFTEVATSDPISAVLVATGALLVGLSSGAFGYLALRGVGEWFNGSPGQGPPRQAR